MPAAFASSSKLRICLRSSEMIYLDFPSHPLPNHRNGTENSLSHSHRTSKRTTEQKKTRVRPPGKSRQNFPDSNGSRVTQLAGWEIGLLYQFSFRKLENSTHSFNEGNGLLFFVCVFELLCVGFARKNRFQLSVENGIAKRGFGLNLGRSVCSRLPAGRISAVVDVDYLMSKQCHS